MHAMRWIQSGRRLREARRTPMVPGFLGCPTPNAHFTPRRELHGASGEGRRSSSAAGSRHRRSPGTFEMWRGISGRGYRTDRDRAFGSGETRSGLTVAAVGRAVDGLGAAALRVEARAVDAGVQCLADARARTCIRGPTTRLAESLEATDSGLLVGDEQARFQVNRFAASARTPTSIEWPQQSRKVESMRINADQGLASIHTKPSRFGMRTLGRLVEFI